MSYVRKHGLVCLITFQLSQFDKNRTTLCHDTTGVIPALVLPNYKHRCCQFCWRNKTTLSGINRKNITH